MYTGVNGIAAFALLPRGAFAIIMLLAAWPIARSVSSIPLGRMLVTIGVISGSMAVLSSIAHVLLEARSTQLAQIAHFLVALLGIMGLLGMGIGFLGFPRRPRLGAEDLRIAAKYRLIAALCLLALISMTLMFMLMRTFHPEGALLGSLRFRGSLGWWRWRLILWFGFIPICAEASVLLVISRRHSLARALFSNKLLLYGALPLCMITVVLFYSPVWFCVNTLQGLDRTNLQAWLGHVIIDYFLAASAMWYWSLPYMVEDSADGRDPRAK